MIKDATLLGMAVVMCVMIGYMYARIEALEDHRIEITAAADAVARANEVCRVHFANL